LPEQSLDLPNNEAFMVGIQTTKKSNSTRILIDSRCWALLTTDGKSDAGCGLSKREKANNLPAQLILFCLQGGK